MMEKTNTDQHPTPWKFNETELPQFLVATKKEENKEYVTLWIQASNKEYVFGRPYIGYSKAFVDKKRELFRLIVPAVNACSDEMTKAQKQAYSWALKQDYQSVAAVYAKELAQYIQKHQEPASDEDY